jgi:hypothetical protein
MEEIREIKRKAFVDEEKKPYGRSIRSPIELCGRNLERPMYPLMIHLCYFCQKTSSEKECFETNSGRWYFNVQMCPRCCEFNRASQEAGNMVIKRYISQEKEADKATTDY